MDKYFQHREAYLKEHFSDVDLYPHSFEETTTITSILELYQQLENDKGSFVVSNYEEN